MIALQISVGSCFLQAKRFLFFCSIRLSFQKVDWIGLHELFLLFCTRSGSQENYNLGILGLIMFAEETFCPTFSSRNLKQYWHNVIVTILNKNLSFVFFLIFFMFRNWLSNHYRAQKQLCSGFVTVFLVTEAETSTFFGCLMVWWKKQLFWILSLFSNP